MVATDDNQNYGGQNYDGEDKAPSLLGGVFQRLKNAPLLAGLCVGIVILIVVLFAFSGEGPAPEAEPLVVSIGAPDEDSIASADATAAEVVAGKSTTLSEDSAPAAQVPVVAEAALLITDIGISRRITEAVIKQLPKSTTVAVSPYATNPQTAIATFKAAGNDLWLQIATRSMNPGIDPGPLALSTEMGTAENQTLLDRQIAAAGPGFMGLYIPTDADLTQDNTTWESMATDLIGKNLMILDGTMAKVPMKLYVPKGAEQISAYLKTDVIIPGDKGPEALKKALADALPVILREREAIVVLNHPTTLAVTLTAEWVKTLRGHGVELVPASKFTGLKP